MKRTSAIDFMGVVRIAGYSLAIVMALVAAALFLAGLLSSSSIGLFMVPALMPAIVGLLVAWVAMPVASAASPHAFRQPAGLTEAMRFFTEPRNVCLAY